MTSLTNQLFQKYCLYKDVLKDIKPKNSDKINLASRYSVSPYALHYAIVEKIEGFPDWFIKNKMGDLNTATTTRKLTPIHLATITAASGDFTAIKIINTLISAGANLDAQDSGGWTPLHHAALWQQQDVIRVLKDGKADQTLTSKTGGTYQNILGLLGWNEKSLFEEIDLYGERKGIKLTGEEFTRLTSANYVTEMRCTPDQLLKQWSLPQKLDPPESLFAFKKTLKFTTPPIHQMKKVTHDSAGRALSQPLGYGLFTAQKISAGVCIGEYLGSFEDDVVSTPYTLACRRGGWVEAEKMRNGIPQINDGFINVVLIHENNSKGLMDRACFFTTDELKEGEQFCWNYGFVFRRKVMEPYEELRPKEARDFVKKHTLDFLLNNFMHVGEGNASFVAYANAEKFRYLLETPSVIFLMMIDNTITIGQGCELLKWSTIIGCITEDDIKRFEEMPMIAEQCRNLLEKFKGSSDLTKMYFEYIVSLPGQYGLICALAGLKQLNIQLNSWLAQKTLITDLIKVFPLLARENQHSMQNWLKKLLETTPKKSKKN